MTKIEGGSLDYFEAQEARRKLEIALGKAIISPDRTDYSIPPMRPVGEHVVSLGPQATPKESMSEYVIRRRAELEKQQEELAFLQDVAELMRKHPKFFDSGK